MLDGDGVVLGSLDGAWETRRQVLVEVALNAIGEDFTKMQFGGRLFAAGSSDSRQGGGRVDSLEDPGFGLL